MLLIGTTLLGLMIDGTLVLIQKVVIYHALCSEHCSLGVLVNVFIMYPA